MILHCPVGDWPVGPHIATNRYLQTCPLMPGDPPCRPGAYTPPIQTPLAFREVGDRGGGAVQRQRQHHVSHGQQSGIEDGRLLSPGRQRTSADAGLHARRVLGRGGEGNRHRGAAALARDGLERRQRRVPARLRGRPHDPRARCGGRLLLRLAVRCGAARRLQHRREANRRQANRPAATSHWQWGSSRRVRAWDATARERRRLLPHRVPVAAVINWFGITDVPDVIDGPNLRAPAARWFGDMPNRLDLAKKVSPLTYVRAGLPPIITIHGERRQAEELPVYSFGLRRHVARLFWRPLT